MFDQAHFHDLTQHELANVTGGIKDVFERTKPHCNVGTIGHVDFIPKVQIEIVVAE